MSHPAHDPTTPGGTGGHGPGHGPGKLQQEDDKIATNSVIAVGVFSLVLFTIGIIGSVFILRATKKSWRPDGPDKLPAVGQAEVGMVNQLPFDTDDRCYVLKRKELARLEGYGWVDRTKGVVHIPIEHAMELVVSTARAGAPAEGEKKPAEGAAQPAEGEKKPAEGAAPAEGEQKPAEGAQPAEGQKPAEGAAKPAEGDKKPAEGAAQPAEGDKKPAEGAAKPAEGDKKPAEGAAKPAEGDKKPAEKKEGASPTP